MDQQTIINCSRCTDASFMTTTYTVQRLHGGMAICLANVAPSARKESIRIITITTRKCDLELETSQFWYTRTSSEYLGQVHMSRSSDQNQVTGAKSVCVFCSQVACFQLKYILIINKRIY